MNFSHFTLGGEIWYNCWNIRPKGASYQAA